MKIHSLDLATSGMSRKDKRITKGALAILLVAATLFVCIALSLLMGSTRTERAYDRSLNLYNEGRAQYSTEILLKSREGFSELGNYKDAPDYVKKIDTLTDQIQAYEEAEELLDKGDLVGAMLVFRNLDGFRDSANRANSISLELYESALKMIEGNKTDRLDEAEAILRQIPDWSPHYELAKELLNKIKEFRNGVKDDAVNEEKYLQGKSAMDEENNLEAQRLFLDIKGYKDTLNLLYKIGTVIYTEADGAYKNKSYDESLELINHIDSMEEWAGYTKTVQLKADVERQKEHENTIDTHKETTTDISEELTTDTSEEPTTETPL